MKKVFSVLVALMMLFALCIPAFAGDAVDALTDEDAKLFAQAVLDFEGSLKFDMDTGVAAGVQAVPVDHLTDADRCAEIASLAADALVEDGKLPADLKDTFVEKSTAALVKVYNEKDLGISTFDPSEVVDNIAGGFSDNDLAGLFDTLRNTITDLSDRLSNAFTENSGSGDGTTTTDGNGTSTAGGDSSTDTTYGGTEPTGDTAIYAVAGVAAAAAVALVLTKKKSK
ncbi:MAG: hypothetical protein ACI4K9_01595 [Candidatus Fimenecus sp.]